MQSIDSLPTGPRFKLLEVTVEGDHGKVEEVETWMRDPNECIAELIGNPEFHNELQYAPERLWTDANMKERVYGEMWTGDKWWEIQVSLIIVHCSSRLICS